MLLMGSAGGTSIDDLLSQYAELVLALKSKFPRTDLRFLLELMSHEFLHPEHVPTLQIEIFYKDGIDLDAKAGALQEKTNMVASIYASEKRLVIEPRLKLSDMEELARDRDIESLSGSLICCTDTLLSRRKHLV